MNHRVQGRKLGRRADQRTALLRNLTISLIEHGRIETTVTRAKEVRRVAERLVTYAKRGDLHGRRLIVQKLGNQTRLTATLAGKLLDDIAPRYKDRNGGYTRIMRVGLRRGDAAPLALIEWVEGAAAGSGEGKKKRAGASGKSAAPKTTKAAKAPKSEAATEAAAPAAKPKRKASKKTAE